VASQWLGNLIVIAQVMAPAFRSQVAPKIPERLGRPYNAIAVGHATVGCVAELLALYIILAAGTKILPKSLRLVRYKLWMRSRYGGLLCFWVSRRTPAGMLRQNISRQDTDAHLRSEDGNLEPVSVSALLRSGVQQASQDGGRLGRVTRYDKQLTQTIDGTRSLVTALAVTIYDPAHFAAHHRVDSPWADCLADRFSMLFGRQATNSWGQRLMTNVCENSKTASLLTIRS
jgi:hypothetical protein